MYDIFYISKEKDNRYYELKSRFPLLKIAIYEEKGQGFFIAQKKSLSKFFWVIDEEFSIHKNFTFDYVVPEWDSKFVHIFKQENGLYGGLYLIPKDYKITQKESEYNFFITRKDIDVVFGYFPSYDQFIIEKPEDYYEAQKKSKTSMFYALKKDFKLKDGFKFEVPKWDKKYVHVFKKQDNEYGGVSLIPRDYPISKREAEYSFFINKKEIDLIACTINYDKFIISKPEDYFEAQKKCKTSMFYAIDKDFKIVDDWIFEVPDHDKDYVHVFKNNIKEFEGLSLIPKDYKITQKESEYNFFINKKEFDLIACTINYDKFIISKPEDYFEAQKKCKTSMFYTINRNYCPIFNFDYIVPDYEKTYVNVFKTNTNEYGEVLLIPKDYIITKNEAKHNFFINKKELEIVASKLQFDIIFVSYNEPNAEENYEKLLKRFPYAQRVHGVKGIHQAHIAAAKKAETNMFWVVDGDAIIEEDFDFYMEIPKWDWDAVHVFRSRNPINNLVYGYGGVKLLPTKLVIDMDINSVDMTTSISKKFISVDKVSNITAFNTDPFNTWKSAFRECVKLSSKVINGQVDDETQYRLNVWQTVGVDKKFGEYAIKGSRLGHEFGTMYSDKKEMLSKINDWKWLEDEFKKC